MGKQKTYILLTFFMALIFSGLGQKFSNFDEDSEKFLGQLNDMFSKVNIKEDRKTCEDMMEQYTEYWNTGVFNKELKLQMKYICNEMLDRRLRAFPDFFYYLSSSMGMMDLDQSTESYNAWHKSLDVLVNDRRSSKPYRNFIKTSYDLLYQNILYQSRATKWRTNSYEYEFKYDSVPYIVFDEMDLSCVAYKDSSVILNTTGIFYPIENTWKGKNGKVDWRRAGFDTDVVYALLDAYQISLSFSKFSADSVKFFHKLYWPKPLLGKLDEKVLANVTPEKATYPQFTSYLARVEIKSLFKDVDYKGGVEIHGRKFIGISDNENLAQLIFSKDNREFVRLLADSYVIYPERVSSSFATVTIYFETDSIYHPGLRMNFVDDNRELALVRSGEGVSKSPFFDSYHNLDIYAEAIYWQTNKPTLDFGTIKGASGMGRATFESSNYFARQRYERLQGIDMMNPLNQVKSYIDKYNVSEVSVQGLAEELRLPQEQIIAMLVRLSNQGFLIYERETKRARVKDKLSDYIQAVAGKRDYDVIQFNSQTYGSQNASLELDSFDLRLYGVPRVFLSDSQNVFIYPTNQELIVKGGMDFTFSGRVHAGTFDFYTRTVNFNYDQFKLDMPVIDSMSFYVPSFERDEFGRRKLKKVRNVVSNLGGDLLIDEPNNKSGLKNFPGYPIFTSTKDAYVYYDHPSIFNGVYKRDKFYFYVYPFTIDSLDNFKTELLQFEGYLASAGIFKDIEDTLRVTRDYSLGFETNTPESGFDAYGGKGTYYNDVRLSNEGLRGKGKLEYVTSTSWSDDYQFFPDSCNTLADRFEIREQLTPIEFPAVEAEFVWQHWIPYRDRMEISYTEFPIQMFNKQSELLGNLVLTPKELKGDGTMSFEDAEMKSDLYTFQHHEIFADSADFNLKSAEYIQSAFATSNYKSHIDFEERKGEFVSNGGASFVDFPINRYVCLIDEFDWFMDSYEIAIGSTEKEAEMSKYNNLTIRELIDVPLQGSLFISTHPDQDSLQFISTIASYNLKAYTLYANDVKFIRVADAAVFPSDQKLVVKEDAKMSTIPDAQILANTVTRYHEIYDAVVDIKGRKDYSGIGNYDYIDENDQPQQVFLREMGVDPSYQTIGNAKVSDTMGFKLSKDFYFTGEINLAANNKFLNFDGGFRIREQCHKAIGKWIKFNTDVNPKDIYLNIEEDLFSMENEKMESSIMFSNELNQFYSGFLTPKKSQSDFNVLAAHGYIHYDKGMDQYDIASENKLKGLTMAGNQITLDRRRCILSGEGRVRLGAELGRVKMQTFGNVTYYMVPDTASIDVVSLIDFPFDNKALDIMGEEIAGKNLKGVNITRPVFLKALTDILGEKDAEKIVADIRLFGKFRKYPSDLEKTIVISDMKLKWNYATRSYISYGPIGLSSVGKNQVNKYVEGWVELERKRTGDVLTIYIELEKGKSWYYFNYRNNLLQTISSNTEYNNYIRELKDDKRTIKKDKEGEEYSFIISNLRKKTDFIRRMQQF